MFCKGVAFQRIGLTESKSGKSRVSSNLWSPVAAATVPSSASLTGVSDLLEAIHLDFISP